MEDQPLPQPGPPQQGPPQAKSQGLAIAGMVLGICGLVIALFPCCWYVGALVGMIGIALSAVALVQINAGHAGGKGMAVAGLATGVVGILVGISWFIIGILFTTAAESSLDGLQKELERISEEQRQQLEEQQEQFEDSSD